MAWRYVYQRIRYGVRLSVYVSINQGRIKMLIKNLLRKLRGTSQGDKTLNVIYYSNAIQYDEMGYPLRLVIVDNGDGTTNHLWIDIDVREIRSQDFVLKWK